MNKKSPSNAKRITRNYSDEFKQDAVNLVLLKGYSISQAAQSLAIGTSTLHGWIQKHQMKSQNLPKNESMQKLIEENKKLRKQLQQAELERTILKKAAAYFAKESQ